MKHFPIELRAVSPLAIRSDHAAGRAETAKYISGTTLAGSLATVHRLLHSEQVGEFEALFLNERVHYPNLYPASFKAGEMQDAKLPVYPIPKTAQSCKRFPDFRYRFDSEDDDEERHGVRDGLLDWAMFKLSTRNGYGKDHVAPLKALQEHKLCEICGAPMDRFPGYYRQDAIETEQIISAQVDSHTRLQTHTGINRESGTIQEGILYNREVFEEDMRFWGMVKLPEDEKLAQTFKDFVEEVGHSGLVRIGTGRTRGMGKVTLAEEPLEGEEARYSSSREERYSSSRERLMAFNTALKKKARELGLENLEPFYFAVTLHSPLILCDSLLRYQGMIDGDTLASLAGLPPSNIELIYQAASVRRVMGWNELWGMPRTHEYAIETGSVFLFASSLDAEDAVLKLLFELEERGIGRRRAEGFGWVCVSDPFHVEVELR